MNTIKQYVIIAKNTKVGEGVFIDNFCNTGKDSEIGDGTTLRQYIVTSVGSKIGKNCFLGPGVIFLGQDINGIRMVTIVEDDCYIGAGSILHAGVIVGRGSIIGAMSNVTKDVPPGILAYGNPCRVVKSL